ncbi:hypothetical protein EXIGLDRAFT_374663 [Exidia glandulosa HHB12029]|uniref:Uncharacterized protein n=1 Tax=Exidia glandulosa HHB12029 TaxID=1314781 RepID=A0A165PYV1_EXIGL|nr:hypothetical protein EXIGLDRAFT_374663 [Exidia glandulosa HHB12029]
MTCRRSFVACFRSVMALANPLLELDSTTLLFLPPSETSTAPACVVQVAVRAPNCTVETIARFFRAQRDVSKLVRILVTSHVQVKPLPTSIVIKGQDYVVEASHKPWDFGKTWTFGWGEDVVESAADKWRFVFRAV